MSRPPFSRGRLAPLIVLPDTSVWVSFLREGAHGRAAALDGLLAGQQVVACRPVVAEILAGARDVQRSELRILWSCLPRADLGRRQWQHVGGLAARLRPGHIGTTGVAALRPRLPPPSDTSLVQYRWDGTGGQRLAAQKISSSGYGGSGATAPYATLKLLPPSPGADGTDTRTEFWTITIAGSAVSDPTTLVPVMVVGVYSASGYWFPVDESVGASTIHSAELPGPVYVCVVLKLEPVVSSVRVIDQSDPLTWAMSIVTLSPALRG